MRAHSFINFCFAFLAVLLAVSCSQKPEKLHHGTWRGVLKTQSGVEIPFNFNLKDSAGNTHMEIINGSENFKIEDVRVTADSVFISIPLFESEIRVKRTGGLQGRWIKHLADRDAVMDFSAQPNVSWRFFDNPAKTDFNISGRWSAILSDSIKKDTTLAVGEFKQNGTSLTGTFLTTTGDYRFLEGTVSDGKLFLSGFNGASAVLFTADIADSTKIINGKLYSGFSSIKNWSAVRDAKAMLPDAYSLTGLKPGLKQIDFSFPDLNGRKVSLSDKEFDNKVVVVQFLGTWCPNCMDETAFLAPFYKNYRDKGFEIIGLAYERTKDFERSKKNLQHFKKRFNVEYPLLITGFINNKDEVMESIPMLNDFKAFPTTIVIDRQGNVRKIHTGFSGPGTGIHYEEFTKEFTNLIDGLLAENGS